ncbi:hypothetical protein DESUT3_01560 [Desulfuromonas versatilis]|uniref:Lipoprotein n=1 Tax=Desulfuromonas versatilis TaxID=2802975 RepID=A0ABM8HNP5_9BACT|nr:hypothetical protein [Desulfuromonas versatilis]BCR03087.1 hypothetical protein DESUT3_01560 [Desulfuromonas versatilis]
MRKLAAYITTALLVLSLAACATSTATGEKAKVKCPACGYEFTPHTSPGN